MMIRVAKFSVLKSSVLLTLWCVLHVGQLAARADIAVDAARQIVEEKGNQLQDSDLLVVGKASGLTELDLSQCGRVSDQGLANLEALSSLRKLKLAGCRRITAAGMKHLQPLAALESVSLERVGPALQGLHELREDQLEHLDVSPLDGVVNGKLLSLFFCRWGFFHRVLA